VHSVRGLEHFLKVDSYHGQHAAAPHPERAPPLPRTPTPQHARVAAETASSTSSAERERREHVHLVLSEQDRLRTRSSHGQDAPSLSDFASSLSEVSSRSSCQSRTEALERGMKDAVAVSRLVDSQASPASRMHAVRGRRFARAPHLLFFTSLGRQEGRMFAESSAG
jgi:hypothetical protein